jgi:hypothetical protein
MLRTLSTLLLVSAVLPACSVSEADDAECSGGKCDGEGGGTCPDKRYGNGVCDPQLDCAVPDIDCFHTFDSDEQAASWFSEFEQTWASQRGSPARAVMPTTDPRFARVRELLDRGWAAFAANRPVGLLAGMRPALVLVDDPAINAFVAPDIDRKHAGFAVMVQTGLLGTNDSEDAMLGLMMHELQHAIGLHVLPPVKESFSRFYVAPDGKEPIGRMQEDDPRVRPLATQWLAAAGDVGSLSNVELGGMPFDGAMFTVLRHAAHDGLAANPAACTPSIQLVNQLAMDVAAAQDPLGGAATFDATMTSRIDTAFDQLKTQCLPNYTMTFSDIVAPLAGMTPAEFEATLSPEDKALVVGKHIVDAIRAVGEDRRAKMRAIETSFATEVGHPWSSLRYFSTEEDADDTSVPVLRGAGFQPTGLADFLGVLLPEATASRCRSIIDAGGVPPYGANLSDDHHGTCFRIYHIGEYAKVTAKKERVRVAAPSEASRPERLVPPLLGDTVAY